MTDLNRKVDHVATLAASQFSVDVQPMAAEAIETFRCELAAVGIAFTKNDSRDDKCGLCGETATGSAFVNGVRFCHDDDDYGVQTCYMQMISTSQHAYEIALAAIEGHRIGGGDTLSETQQNYARLVVEALAEQDIIKNDSQTEKS